MCTCQIGAEPALKGEFARRWPQFRFAYSRPGFLTFKFSADTWWAADLELESVFARAYAFSLGKVIGEDADARARQVWQVCRGLEVRRVHVWQRDASVPDDPRFTHPVTPAADDAAQRIFRQAPRAMAEDAAEQGKPADPSDMVLDCVLVRPNEWWVGFHQAGPQVASRWSGGARRLELPQHAVSRAWLKMEEALEWSGLPLRRGAECAELGSSPGGATQSLLGRGMRVTGIDPAQMHPSVLAHPRFTHVRRRANQVRRRQFRKIRWLLADMNVAPRFTLDVLESIVTHPEVQIQGMLVTLKLVRWELADGVPEMLDRVRGWGYRWVRARQLLYNRQEICVAAMRK
jgi:23S rRNA (cytidine2498-2'-O)-methyltransferase